MNWVEQAHEDHSIVEVKWMWLPVFLGQNTSLMAQMEIDLNKQFKGEEFTPENRAAMNTYVISWLSNKVKIPGLEQYLEGIKYIQES